MAQSSDVEGALSVAESISDDSYRAEALSAVIEIWIKNSDALTDEPEAVVVYICEKARVRGWPEMLTYIQYLAPVLSKLDIISQVWVRLQAMEVVLGREPAFRDSKN